MKLQIRHRYKDVAPFIDQVRSGADSEKEILGFLPARVYERAALQEKLLVATTENGKKPRYVGHLLFGGVFPQGCIFQVFVGRGRRGRGIAGQLVREVINKLTAQHYLSIRAKVADDLRANSFWQKMGFSIVRTRTGGAARNRVINVRVRDLETPSLLNLLQASTPSAAPADLRLIERLGVRSPVYLIDLNILFDLTKRRVRSEKAGLIIRAGFVNAIRLAISEEFLSELRRSSPPSQPDPTLELARQLPVLFNPPSNSTPIDDALAKIVFPERFANANLSVQDKSDVAHLATAIHHRAAGFVTNEKAILRNRNKIQSDFGIDVVSSDELAAMVDAIDPFAPPIRAIAAGIELHVRDLSDTLAVKVDGFLERLYVPPQQREDVLANGGPGSSKRRITILCKDDVIGYATWETAPTKEIRDVFICVDEGHLVADAATDHLIDKVCSESSRLAPVLLRLRELPGHSFTRQKALAHGFRAVGGSLNPSSTMQKVCIGRVVDSSDWGSIRHQLKAASGVVLPAKQPAISDAKQQITVESPSGSSITISLFGLESLLSPVLFLFPHRFGVIAPIQRHFSDELLGLSPQGSLLASREASMLKERIYFSSERTMATFKEGAPLLFYESGKKNGQKAVVAFARIVKTQLLEKQEIENKVLRRGVIERSSFDKLSQSRNLAATTFDNILPLSRPVSFARLKAIGCIDDSNLVTARKISATHIKAILEESNKDA